MEIVRNPWEFCADKKTAVTIGKFDGIHKGHQLPLKKIINRKKEGYHAVVFTFEPSPAAFFGWGEPGVLMSPFEKRRVFENLGVDILVEYPFNKETASISPRSFIEDLLCRQLKASYIAVGEDVSFGDKGLGDAAMLREYSKKYGFEVEIMEKIRYDGEVISSSRIKKELLLGNMEMVRELIGYPYCITGDVIHGAHMGTGMGMPTINLVSIKEKLLPPCGVYYSFVSCKGVHYRSISNVGYKPTVSDGKVCGVETYLYDFNGDLYGETVTVNLLSFKRPEMRFPSVDALMEQMRSDILSGEEFHKVTEIH